MHHGTVGHIINPNSYNVNYLFRNSGSTFGLLSGTIDDTGYVMTLYFSEAFTQINLPTVTINGDPALISLTSGDGTSTIVYSIEYDGSGDPVYEGDTVLLDANSGDWETVVGTIPTPLYDDFPITNGSEVPTGIIFYDGDAVTPGPTNWSFNVGGVSAAPGNDVMFVGDDPLNVTNISIVDEEETLDGAFDFTPFTNATYIHVNPVIIDGDPPTQTPFELTSVDVTGLNVLNDLDLFKCGLSSAAVDAVLAAMEDIVAILGGTGTIELRGNAIPGTGGFASKAYIDSQGWTCNVTPLPVAIYTGGSFLPDLGEWNNSGGNLSLTGNDVYLDDPAELYGLIITDTTLVDGTLNLSACYNCQNLYITGTGIATASVNGLTNFTDIHLINNPDLVTVIVTGCTNLNQYEADNIGITSLDLSAFATNLYTLDVINCISLASVDFPPSVQYVTLNNNAITALDFSTAPNIIECYVNGNVLTSVDISNHTILERLECYNNDITTLDASGCTSLVRIYCYTNDIISIDTSGDAALTYLFCNDNNLSTLDLTDNAALWVLHCHDNSFTTLDFTGATGILDLNCRNNALSSLDVSVLPSVSLLDCSNTTLTVLDLSTNVYLGQIRCNNNSISALNITNTGTLNYVDFSYNSLTSFSMANCVFLTTVICNNNLLTSITSFNDPPLTTLTANDNAFDSAGVDSLLAGLVLTNESNGTTNLTNNAIPGAAGLADKATLEGNGWTVLVDS